MTSTTKVRVGFSINVIFDTDLEWFVCTLGN